MGTPTTADAEYEAFATALESFLIDAQTTLQNAINGMSRAEEDLNHAPSSQSAQTHLANCKRHLDEVRKSIRALATAFQNAGMGLEVIVHEDSPLQPETPQPETPQHEMILHRFRSGLTGAEVIVGLQQPSGFLTPPAEIPDLHDDASSSSADSEDLR